MTSRKVDGYSHEYCELCEYFRLELQHDGRCLERCSVTGERLIWGDKGFNKSDNCPFMGTREEAKADSGRE